MAGTSGTPAGIAVLSMRMNQIFPHLELDAIQAIDPERRRPGIRRWQVRVKDEAVQGETGRRLAATAAARRAAAGDPEAVRDADG